jgi:hypothetical protein
VTFLPKPAAAAAAAAAAVHVTTDYAPFDVDVTTLDPGDAALMGTGQRAVIYGDMNTVSGNDAGIAFIGSFAQGAPAFICAQKLGPNNPKVSGNPGLEHFQTAAAVCFSYSHIDCSLYWQL